MTAGTVVRYTSRVPALKRNVRVGSDRALENLARLLEKRAATAARRAGRHRTGRMEGGFKAWVTKTPTHSRATLGNKMWYARLQNDGTKRGVEAARFFETALQSVSREALPTIRRYIGRET